MAKEVLIVDDANFMRRILTKVVKTLGFKVIATAQDGQEAIEKYKNLKPDIVTMDITMPKMSGIEAIKNIIAHDPQAIIIACSAMGEKEVIMEAFEAGAKDFIVKPFQEEKVVSILKNVLQQEKEKFELSITTEGEGAVKSPKEKFAAGEEVTLLSKPAPGYILKYWEVNGEYKGKQATLELIMDQNKEVLVVFEAAKFELNVNSEQGQVNVEPEKEFYYYGDTVTLSAKTKKKWEFIAWKHNNNIISDKKSIKLTIESDMDIKAVFDYPLQLEIEKKEYNVEQNQKITFEIKTDYYDNSLIRLSDSGLPNNSELINISNDRTRFYWKPNYNQAGVYDFKLVAQAEDKSTSENIRINVKEINNFTFKFNPNNYDLIADDIHSVYLVGEFNNWGNEEKEINYDKCPSLNRVNNHWEEEIEIKHYNDTNKNNKCDFKWLIRSKNYLILPEGDNLNAENSHFSLPDGEDGFHFYLNLKKHYDINVDEKKVSNVYLICAANDWDKDDKTFALKPGKNDNVWRGNLSNLGDNDEFKWVILFKNNKFKMYPEEHNLLLEDEF